MNQSKLNTSATIQDFINSARHNACLLRQMIAAVYGTSADQINVQVNISAKGAER